MALQEEACVYPLIEVACESLCYFDHEKYVAACFELGTYWFICLRPGTIKPSVTQFVPSFQTDDTCTRLKALYAYASRTDPDRSIRTKHLNDAWRDRRQGQKTVYLIK